MSRVAGVILKYGGSTEARIIPIISGTVGLISSFMQNVGATALFLPVVSRISVRTELPLSRLLMPMGFCAILGGTMTMVGSSPLILLNDLIVTANSAIPEGARMETFGLFAVTPIGISLVLAGILYFVLFGRFVLPSGSRGTATSGQSVREYMRRLYGIDTEIFEVVVPAGSDLEGLLMADAMRRHHVHIIGSYYNRKRFFMPPVAYTAITTPCRLAILGEKKEVERLAAEHGARLIGRLNIFADDYAATVAGMAEIVIPPGSSVVGKHAIELQMRVVYGLSVIAIHRGEENPEPCGNRRPQAGSGRKVPLQSGDTLVAFTNWERLAKLTRDRDFVVVHARFSTRGTAPEEGSARCRILLDCAWPDTLFRLAPLALPARRCLRDDPDQGAVHRGSL